ncbi:MAG: glycosyltransferase family 4 protein [Promethearchaeota archaeon]
MSKILYVVPHLDEIGGIQKFALTMYTTLREDFNIELINWKTNWNLPTRAMLYTNLFYPPILDSRFKDIKDKVREAALVHFWHPDLARPFSDISNYIISCHGKEVLPANITYFQRKSYQKIFKKAKAVHVNSKYTGFLVKNIVNIEPKVINPPIDYEKLSSYRPLNQEKLTIGSICRFERRKNIPNIIRALELLNEKIDFKYFLAGSGIEENKVLKLLENSNFEWKYFKRISDEDKFSRFYPSLNIFLMPTLDLPDDVEGYGIVYLEANAFGIPVIASKVGGVSDAVEEHVSGEFADPTNPEDIAEKILSLAERKNELKELCRNHARKFDIKPISKRFKELYES